MIRTSTPAVLCLIVLLALTAHAAAQIPPSAAEIAAYRGLHAAAARGDAGEIENLVRAGTTIDARDSHGRTPVHVAAFMRKQDAARTLLRLGANPNALESQQYDIVTIAAVLYHGVAPNLSETPRIRLSFNFRLKWLSNP